MNPSWFSKDKESNLELLCDIITRMTNLRYLNLLYCRLGTEASEKIMAAIVANQNQNQNLANIDLYDAGGKDNKHFSASTKDKIATLRAKGICIAETYEQSMKMNIIKLKAFSTGQVVPRDVKILLSNASMLLFVKRLVGCRTFTIQVGRSYTIDHVKCLI